MKLNLIFYKQSIVVGSRQYLLAPTKTSVRPKTKDPEPLNDGLKRTIKGNVLIFLINSLTFFNQDLINFGI